jgi:hypothetical protein
MLCFFVRPTASMTMLLVLEKKGPTRGGCRLTTLGVSSPSRVADDVLAEQHSRDAFEKRA